jgi:hypothetical protein
VERILKCTPEQCVCQGRRKATVVIGYEESSPPDVEPAKYGSMWEARQEGPKITAILSVVESRRRLKLPTRDYLAAVLPGLADRPIQCLPDLTPAVWIAQHSSTQVTGV